VRISEAPGHRAPVLASHPRRRQYLLLASSGDLDVLIYRLCPSHLLKTCTYNGLKQVLGACQAVIPCGMHGVGKEYEVTRTNTASPLASQLASQTPKQILTLSRAHTHLNTHTRTRTHTLIRRASGAVGERQGDTKEPPRA
jgi:hypothetical protein